MVSLFETAELALIFNGAMLVWVLEVLGGV
jgi:hypothetical protein